MPTSRAQTLDLVQDIPRQPLINGQWVAGGDPIQVVDPATERPICDVAQAGPEDVDRAVIAARAALDVGEWGRLGGAERGRLLNRAADLLEQNAEAFAAVESLDIGKPGFEPRFIDLPQAIDTFRHFAGWADKIHGRSIPTPGYMGRPTVNYTVREPVGVVAAITPWNSPTMIGAWKIAPALAAGCAVVLKPPEDAPLTSLMLVDLLLQAGFPEGSVGVLPGRGSVTGQALIDHPGVDKISFTGSPEIGHRVAVAAARGFRRTTLELGGKSPQIVFADADLDAAAQGVAVGIFANQGEVCAAGSRILVAREVHDELVERLVERAAGVQVGDPFDEATTMGALINQKQADRVHAYIETGRSEGAKLAVGGTRPGGPGYFVNPTLFVGADNSMRIAREEIFGPVATIIAFDDAGDAVAIANDNDYALAATLWTSDITRAHTVASRIRAGSVAVNGWAPIDPRLPWGGSKQSGLGRELGWAGIEANTEEKTISIVL
jgi:acyl-CoA reductase-like NAD-dependent aldehyde dehydrogenase